MSNGLAAIEAELTSGGEPHGWHFLTGIGRIEDTTVAHDIYRA
jgi:hypothetical protein